MLILMLSMIALVALVFIGLVVFMQKVFNKEVVSATSHLDKLADEYAKKEEAIKKQFEDAKRQSQEIIANAQKDGQQQKDTIAKQALDEKNKVIAEAHHAAEEVIKQADNARLALLAEVEDRISERAVQKASELLSVVLPDTLRADIHEAWVKNLIAGSLENLDRLKIQDGDSAITIISAFALTDPQRGALKAKIKEKMGVEAPITEQVDPQLIAGLVMNIGSACLDGSLRFKIQEVARGKR